MWVFDRKSLRFLAINDAAVQEYGYSREEFLRMTVAQIRPDEDVREFLADVQQTAEGLQKPGRKRHRRKDGSIVDVEIVCDTLAFQGRDAILVAASDITDRLRAEKALAESEERYRATFEDAVIGIFQSTPQQGLVSVNRALAQMHGYASPEHMLRSVKDIPTQVFASPEEFKALMRLVDSEGVVRGYELQVLCCNGSRKWVAINLRAERDPSGAVIFVEGMVEDITGRKAAEARIQFLAFHDPLTGLPNRVSVQDRIQQALVHARESDGKVALLLFDLDGFEILNDSLGHTFGDLVLMKIAERLGSCVGPQDTVARIGGDEFLLVLRNVPDEAHIGDAARRVMETVKTEFAIRGQSMRLTCSMGISVFPDHGNDTETLIQHADSAMYRAKQQRQNSYCVFSGEMHEQAMERLNLEKNLQLALDRDEFFLLFQPQMDIASGTVIGLEALLRWNQPELGLIPPADFIQTAENSSLILRIGEWVLRKACLQAKEWLDTGLFTGPIAVNVSALQFQQRDFTPLVRRILDETGLPPEFLEFEITEGLLLAKSEQSSIALNELKAMGLKLAIDDFGTGYSSLSYLKELPVSKIKIDRSFIRGVAIDADDAAITTAIIHMAHSLNLQVIAEGVENDAQFLFLRENRCDAIQGFYFSPPLDRAGLEHSLRPSKESVICDTSPASPVCAQVP
jgi:diguanylate cyclase (GGDEF)-like protein/PAS domain S-box-containing protein